MTSNLPKRPLSSALRRFFPWLGRERHYASLSTPGAGTSKLEPIAKTVAEAGRNAASPAD